MVDGKQLRQRGERVERGRVEEFGQTPDADEVCATFTGGGGVIVDGREVRETRVVGGSLAESGRFASLVLDLRPESASN